jgi:hypothetical protein
MGVGIVLKKAVCSEMGTLHFLYKFPLKELLHHFAGRYSNAPHFLRETPQILTLLNPLKSLCHRFFRLQIPESKLDYKL